jgi:lysylphosphatidylglycerol synthetase-like protein (DUF2156 family)
MSDEVRNSSGSDAEPGEDSREAIAAALRPRTRELLPLPGLAGISLYMLVLAGVSILGVVNGQFRPVYLIFSAFFITAALGLLRLLRWAWALTLGAIVLLTTLFALRFATERQFPFLVQGLLNLVFFLYLIRTEVRSKLK